MTGSRPAAAREARAGPGGRAARAGPAGRAARGAVAAVGTAVLAASLAACGSESPAIVAGPAQSGAVSGLSAAGASARVGPFVEVIGARILAQAAGSGQAQVAMTLVNTNAGADAVLAGASSPAARAAVFTRQGRVIRQIVIPVAAGSALPVGPPNPDRVLLTGLRERLLAGRSVKLKLVFTGAGHITLTVPVIP
jgi:copper(I)-binding protein